jgi:hypothetical protein
MMPENLVDQVRLPPLRNREKKKIAFRADGKKN